MNKFLFKQVMKGMKIPVVAGFKLSKSDYGDKEYARKLFLRLRFMKFPVVIKPVSGGSSIGLFVARNIDDFKERPRNKTPKPTRMANGLSQNCPMASTLPSTALMAVRFLH